mgnify:CR=1 FL=1
MAVTIGILAFIPGLGPALIWVPLSIIEFLYGEKYTALGVIIFGIFLTVYLDSIFRTKVLSKKTQTHPVVMLFGIIGGVQLFGLIGLIIGPLILIIFLTIIESMPKERAA